MAVPVEDAARPDAADAAPEFTPKSVRGLVLWLDPTVGVTEVAGKVSAWADTSTSAISVTQSVAGNQPSKGTLGGKPVIAGTPTTWLEAQGATVGTKLDFATSDMTAEYVVALEVPSTAALGGVLQKIQGSPPFDGLQLYSNLGGGGKPGAGLDGATLLLTGTSGNTGDGKLHLICYRRVGTRLSLRLDGVELQSSTVALRSIDNTSPLYVGGRPDGVHATNQKFGDILIYKGSVSDAELQRLETYLKTKNGI